MPKSAWMKENRTQIHKLVWVFPVRYVYKQQRKQTLLDFSMWAHIQDLPCLKVFLQQDKKTQYTVWDEISEMARKSCESGEKEWKCCSVTEQSVNDCVFSRLLSSALKHENKCWLWHLGITVLRMYNPQMRLASRNGCKTFLLCVCFCNAFRGHVHIHHCWSKWGPWAFLFEIDNEDEALHITTDWSLFSKFPMPFNWFMHISSCTGEIWEVLRHF